MKIIVPVLLMLSSLVIASARAEVRPRARTQPTAAPPAAQPQYSDAEIQAYTNEQNFAECDSSPGGSAIVPRERLLGLERPAAGNARSRTSGARGTR